MFCKNCGNQLPDTAKFCSKCGNKIDNNVNQNLNENLIQNDNTIDSTINNYESNKVLLEVKPSFKFSYVVLPDLLKKLVYIIPIGIILIYFIVTILNEDTSDFASLALINISSFLPVLLLIFVFGLFNVFSTIGKSFFDKKQYENCVYTFYQNKVVFKDSFMNISEKELKYKDIKEITKNQKFMQRFFNIGNIILNSNAESEFENGIHMVNIENVDTIYKQIKEIVNV